MIRFGNSTTQYCSFCGKQADEYRHLVAAPSGNIYICERCIAVCQEILEEEKHSLPPIEMSEVPSPKEFKSYLDQYIVGQDDAKKVLEVKKQYADIIVCGVNSRNLKDFTIDLLVPAMLKNKLGGKVIFESGISTPEAASKIASMGFTGILLGEFAARNPARTWDFVKAFKETDENLCGKKLVELANKVNLRGEKPMVKICGLTRKEDVLLADELGADFVGFIFATEFGRNVYGQHFDALKDCLGKVKAFKVAVVTRPETEESKAAVQLVKDGVLDFVQLHGITYDQMPDYIKDVPHYFAITKKSKTEDFNAPKLFAYGEPRYLQDSGDHNYETDEHLWLAGGVTCENVESLIQQFQPELVDVSSGIETSELGIKDQAKLRELIKKIKG